MPQKSFGVSHEQNLHILGGSKNAHYRGQKCKNLPNLHIWGSKMSILGGQKCQHLPNFWKICIFVGSKMIHFGGQKCQNLQELFLAPNTPKSYLGVSNDQNLQNLHIWWVNNAHLGGIKCQKLQKMLCSKCPQKSLGVSNNQNLHIWGVKNAHLEVQIAKIWKHFFCSKWHPNVMGILLPQKVICVSPINTSFIFLGANLSAPCCYQYSSL